jgi:DNA-binding CsgD family transcriptional regulator
MLDASKNPPLHRRDHLHNHLAGYSIAVHLDNAVECPDLARPTADLPLYRWFADGLARLIECDRCYVAVLSPHGERIDEVKTGCPVADPVPEATTRAIALQLGAQDGCIFQSIASANGFARRLIGRESTLCPHCVIGKVQSHSGFAALFVGGWRRTSLSGAEFASVTRAIDLTWNAAVDLAQIRTQRQWLWLEDIASPAFVVDENLVVRNMNAGFRQLLDNNGALVVEHGVISGPTPSITSHLRDAVRRIISSDAAQGARGSAVALSNDRQKFLFAVIGPVPGDRKPELVLIVVPQFDAGAGARRIAAAFALSWVEERIVSRILRGRCPRVIGTELGLTEETVRTYIKRIMIKIGINRQSEFFVLHSLTLSPFKARQPDRRVPAMPNFTRIHTRRPGSGAS